MPRHWGLEPRRVEVSAMGVRRPALSPSSSRTGVATQRETSKRPVSSRSSAARFRFSKQLLARDSRLASSADVAAVVGVRRKLNEIGAAILYGLAVTISALPGERDCNFRLRTADAPGGRCGRGAANGAEFRAEDP